jgi:hypothetical protein
MRSLKAFVLGMLAAGVVTYAVAGALAVSAQVSGRALELGLGPLHLVSVVTRGTATTTTFGPGLAVVAVLGGLLNLVAAWAVQRRAEREVDHVD